MAEMDWSERRINEVGETVGGAEDACLVRSQVQILSIYYLFCNFNGLISFPKITKIAMIIKSTIFLSAVRREIGFFPIARKNFSFSFQIYSSG